MADSNSPKKSVVKLWLARISLVFLTILCIPIVILAQELIAIAASGLKRQGERNARGEDETLYLEGLEWLVRSGKSLGRLLAERWEGEWHRDMAQLIAHASYQMPPGSSLT